MLVLVDRGGDPGLLELGFPPQRKFIWPMPVGAALPLDLGLLLPRQGLVDPVAHGAYQRGDDQLLEALLGPFVAPAGSISLSSM